MGRLLDLQASNLVLMALKRSQDDSGQWIVRCYECHGEPAELRIESDLDFAIAHPVDLLERSTHAREPLLTGKTISISPWKIASFSVSFPCTYLRAPSQVRQGKKGI
jgi:alpha-mannosidase